MDRDSLETNYQVKLLLLGDQRVGKTCLLIRYCEDLFPTSHIQTLGIDFKVKVQTIEGETYRVQVWDTAGQERFRKLTTAYYKNAKGIILVYDVTRKESFEMVSFWMAEISKHAAEGVLKVLVANQIDKEGPQVTKQEGKRKADEFGVEFFETSAKTGAGIDRLFRYMAVKSRYIEESNLKGPRASIRVQKYKENKKCCKS
jgi:Ras-related protein Rab-8A